MASELMIENLILGDGKAAVKGALIAAHYYCCLEDDVRDSIAGSADVG